MIRRAGGVLGGKTEFQFEKVIHFECDHPGCPASTDELSAAVARDIDPEETVDALVERLAHAEGWLIQVDRAFCPEHKQEHAPDIAIGDVDTIFSETKPNLPPPPQRQPKSPKISDTSVMNFMALLIIGLGFLLLMGYFRLRSADSRLAWTERDRFEQKAHVTQVSCHDLYSPIHCSGRLSTEGKPDVPVRYVCDTDDCWFEK